MAAIPVVWDDKASDLHGVPTSGVQAWVVMTKLSGFTYQASAEARSAAKHGRDSSAESTPSPLQSLPSPLRSAHRTPDTRVVLTTYLTFQTYIITNYLVMRSKF